MDDRTLLELAAKVANAAARRAIVRSASRFATTAWLIGINVFPTP